MPVAHSCQHGLPGLTDVSLSRVRQAQTLQGAEFEVFVHRDLRPFLTANSLRFDGLPDVNKAMTGNHDILAIPTTTYFVRYP